MSNLKHTDIRIIIDIFLTIITLGILIIAIYIAYSSNKMSQITLEEMQVQHKKSLEPFVVIDSRKITASAKINRKSEIINNPTYKFDDSSDDNEKLLLKLNNIGEGTACFIKIIFSGKDYRNWCYKIIDRYSYPISDDYLRVNSKLDIIEEVLFLAPRAESNYYFTLPDRYIKIIHGVMANYQLIELPSIKIYFEFFDIAETYYHTSASLNINVLSLQWSPHNETNIADFEARYIINMCFGEEDAMPTPTK